MACKPSTYIVYVLLLATHVLASPSSLLSKVAVSHAASHLLDFRVRHILHPLLGHLKHLGAHVLVHVAQLCHLHCKNVPITTSLPAC